VLEDFALLCNMISTTTAVALEGFLFFLQNLVFEFVLLVLIFLSFFEFINILGWFSTIRLFFTL
jgi:hypothetical protein